MSRPGTPGGVKLTPRSGSASPEPTQQHAAGSMNRSDSSLSIADAAKNEQQRSRDNIKVAVRIRPISEKEDGRGDHVAWATDGSGGVGLVSAGSDRINVKYAYDLVFNPSTSNEQLFDLIGRPSIEPVLCGISGTVFAYGVTSSGKTHTMMGTPADPGVVPRAIQALFQQIGQDQDRVFSVTCSMLEIYCEMLNDLLDPSKLNLDVQERELPGGKGTVLQVKGLTATKVSSAEAALGLIQSGLDNRKVAATAYNDQSSRSHTLCRFLVEGSPASSRLGASNVPGSGAAAGGSCVATTRTSAWLTLVDLAGSEGAKPAMSKDQAAEARDINRSLLTLGKVMYELAKGAAGGHVPFRDSLLTRLLKPSLTGVGAKVAIICNVTPASSQSEETLNTLRFADGAKRIKVSAVRNEALDVAAVVAQYQREVASLKAQLAALTGAAAAGGGALSPQVLEAMQATLAGTSHANQEDLLADQEAQLRHLQESIFMVVRERDQLLAMNRTFVSLLVAQIRHGCPPEAASGPPEAAAATSGAGAAGSCDADGADVSCGSCAGARTTALKRCLSFESLPYYSSWQQRSRTGNPTPGSQQDMQQLAGMGGLIRLTQDDLPDLVAPGPASASNAAQEQHQEQAGSAEQAGSEGGSASGAALSTRPAVAATAAAATSVAPVVYFPGNRRTSKTLALAPEPAAVPLPTGAVAAAWLAPGASAASRAAGTGCCCLGAYAGAGAAAAAALHCTAVSEVVEVHRRQAVQDARLQALLQLLEGKEGLLAEARLLQASQVMQLRLTITAADRALLRDRLAEAEQQLASYQSIMQACESEKEELYDTACSLFGTVEQLSEEKSAVMSELGKLRSQLDACSTAHGSHIATAPAGPAASSGNAFAGGSGCSSCQHAVLDYGGSGGSSSSRRGTIPHAAGIRPAPCSGGAAGFVTPPRPKSAQAAFGPGRPRMPSSSSPSSSAAAGSATSNVTPRTLSSVPSMPSSSSSTSNVAAATATRCASSLPNAAPAGPDVGLNNLNPICITSPFSASAAAGCPGGSPGSAGGSINPAEAALFSNSVLTTGSRIPLPPCLQQRPSRIAGSDGSSSIMLQLANMKMAALGTAVSNAGGGSSSPSKLPLYTAGRVM